MEGIEVALFVLIITTWFFSRQMILKYKPIPKWLDISIAIVFSIVTMYVVYDTFMIMN
jgi:hypothetical protein